MDNAEAAALLKVHMEGYRVRHYCDLVRLVGNQEVVELRGVSGVTYQLEVDVQWDGLPGGALRVIGSMDDGGWRAFKPLCDDFVVAPDGRVGGR